MPLLRERGRLVLNPREGRSMRVRLAQLSVNAFALLAPSTTSAWTPAGQATIHPGVQTFTAEAQCTANFVYSDGANVYLGQAAHCSGTRSQTDTNGCTSGSLPIGTP